MSKTFMDAIEQCAKEGTQAGKLAAISGIKTHHQRLIHEALNRHRRFNVRDWPEPKYSKTDYPVFVDFYKLLDALNARTITGNAAREAVARELSKFTKRTAGYLARVILKDLDCGADAKTFLKVYPEIDLPSFKVMLAKKMDADYKWKFPCQAEVKYDGFRVVAFCSDGEVSYVSRSGRPADFCKGLFDDDMRAIEENLGYPVAVDGEVLGADFQDSAQAKGKKGVEHKERLRLYAFDMMPLAEWTNRSCLTAQSDRSFNLAMVLADSRAKKIVAADSRTIYSKKDAEKFFESVVKNGEPGKDEGLIIKDPHARYSWDRSKAWVKWKPVYTFDLTVVSVTEGKGKFKGMMGALECMGEDENGRKISASVGGGFKDKDRVLWWKLRDKMVGITIEVECGKMTKSKNSEVWSLRFPEFLRIRTDK